MHSFTASDLASLPGPHSVKRSRSPDASSLQSTDLTKDTPSLDGKRRKGRDPAPTISNAGNADITESPHLSTLHPPPPKSIPTKPAVLKAFPTVRDHTTDQLNAAGDEYIPREFDPAGETKINQNGQLLDGRQYRCRTFLVPGRGDKLFMLGIECARVLNYRDSYLLFDKNRTLYKILANQAEKDNLIQQEILPYSYRSRQIALVTAHSMFRQFGSRVIVNGRRVRDDYWERKARRQGFTEDDAAGEKQPGAAKEAREAAAAASNAIALASPPHGEIIYSNGPGLDEYSGMRLPYHSGMQRPPYEPSVLPYGDPSTPAGLAEIFSQASQPFTYNKATSRQVGDSRRKWLDEQWPPPQPSPQNLNQDHSIIEGHTEADIATSPLTLQSPPGIPKSLNTAGVGIHGQMDQRELSSFNTCWIRLSQFLDMVWEDNMLQAVCLEGLRSSSDFERALLGATTTLTDYLHPREGVKRKILNLHPDWPRSYRYHPPGNTHPRPRVKLEVDLVALIEYSKLETNDNWYHSIKLGETKEIDHHKEIEVYDEMHSLEEATSFLRESHAYQRFRMTMLKYVHERRRAMDDWEQSTLATQPASIFDSIEEETQQLKATEEQISVKYCISWELDAFKSSELRKGDDIGSVVTLNGTLERAYATTCLEYFSFAWPDLDVILLRELLHLSQDRFKKGATAFTTFDNVQIYPCSAVTSEEGSCTFQLRVEGLATAVINVGKLLAWITTAFREPIKNTLAYSDCVFGHLSPYVFDIRARALRPVEADISCWQPLFQGAVMAHRFPVPARSDEKGLEIPFDLMVALGRIWYPMEYQNGIVLKGYSTILVPTDQKDDSVQWHFIQTGSHTERIELDTVFKHRSPPIQNVDISTLRSARAYVGWVDQVMISAGSKFSGYSSISDSGTQDQGAGLRLQREATPIIGSSGLGKFGLTLGLKFVLPKSLYMSISQEESLLEDIMLNSKDESTIIYDVGTQRAWLISELSAVLILLHVWAFRQQDYDLILPKLPFASVSKNEGQAAYEAVHAAFHRQSKVWLRSESGDNEGLTLKAKLRSIFTSLQRAKEVSREREASSISLWRRRLLSGFELADIAYCRDICEEKQVRLKKTCGSWPGFLSRNLRVAKLICKGLNDLITPLDNIKMCGRWGSVPKGRSYLASSMQRIVLLQPSLYCISPSSSCLFDGGVCQSKRLQTLTEVKIKMDNPSPIDGAIIIGSPHPTNIIPCLKPPQESSMSNTDRTRVDLTLSNISNIEPTISSLDLPRLYNQTQFGGKYLSKSAVSRTRYSRTQPDHSEDDLNSSHFTTESVLHQATTGHSTHVLGSAETGEEMLMNDVGDCNPANSEIADLAEQPEALLPKHPSSYIHRTSKGRNGSEQAHRTKRKRTRPPPNTKVIDQNFDSNMNHSPHSIPNSTGTFLITTENHPQLRRKDRLPTLKPYQPELP